MTFNESDLEHEDKLMWVLEEIETKAKVASSAAVHKPKVKPCTFNGNSSREDYIAQFDLVAEINNWDSATKASYLAISLTARSVLLL